MDFALRPEQAALMREFREVGREVGSGVLERDLAGEFPRDAWRVSAERGVLGLSVPKAFGGRELDPLSVAAALEGFGHGCEDNGLWFSMGAQMWAVQTPLLLFGSDQQKARYLPELVSGRMIGAHAVTEREAGSDALSLTMRAVRDGSDYVLDGEKVYITNAPVSDLILVVATVDPTQGAAGLVAFVVERGQPGVTVRGPLEKMGMRTAMMGEIRFEGCRVPGSQVLGSEGGGASVFRAALEWERSLILSPALGTMQRQIERSVAHARSRRQFQKPIGKNQAISHKIVEMEMRLETARLLLYKAAWTRGEGKRLSREPSMVKLAVSEAWVKNSLEAVQIFGGRGYLAETGLERDARDALGSRVFSGTSEIQRSLVAGLMGL